MPSPIQEEFNKTRQALRRLKRNFILCTVGLALLLTVYEFFI
jgi:hypothetical protein